MCCIGLKYIGNKTKSKYVFRQKPPLPVWWFSVLSESCIEYNEQIASYDFPSPPKYILEWDRTALNGN
jgi:hypothetical protein